MTRADALWGVLSQIFVRRRLGAWLAASVSVGWQEMIEFKGSHFEWEVILWGVRWYVAYPISYRQLEEMMRERGVEVDHSTLNRWVLKYVPLLDKQFRACKRLVGSSWRMDETYVRVKGPGRTYIGLSIRPAPQWTFC